MSVPHGHWKTTTFVAGLRSAGMVAPFVIDGPINRQAFETDAEKDLAVVGLREPSGGSSTSSAAKCANHFSAAGYGAV